jgi:hypothetical protein
MTIMSDPDREIIKTLDRNRRDIRSALTSGVAQAKQDLHPRTFVQRWKGLKLKQLAALSESGKQTLASNAPLIGLAGTAILLFAARRPISKLYHQMRTKVQKSKDRTS